ncbi:HD-GYP domain-containing protein [Aminipila luticellarii]|uniref:HD-GYP domain-containing protein n=1 Tax=Aminipila luticellarii TaxID=2507160 RepID=A0A410PWP6_9FIRM|nr:HD-GYP domain-containing protein [Aminipila luticellarii]QAT43363.1 HD-GYP domain-containing protein [Aminipila luticellarii]
MIFVQTNQLKPGMIVGQAVMNDVSVIPLLLTDQKLTIRYIRKLRAMNVPGIYIKTKYSEDIVAQGFVDPALKQKITADLKSVCRNFVSKSAITSSMANTLIDVSSSLMDHILSKDEYILNMVEIKTFDNYTYSHSINVASLATLIGIQLGYSRVSLQELTSAGLMHDFGKLEVPIGIVNKPSSLTTEEFAVMKKHPTLAVNKLKSSMKISLTVLDGIASHHEKYDGTGYPNGLSGANIPLCGRILAIADVYDALTTARSYRPAWQTKDALDFMASNSGTHFDPDILNAFFKTISVYPVGTMVKLTDDSIALVIKNTPGCMLDPVVRILSSKRSDMGTEFDLAKTADLHIVKSIDADSEIPMEIFE